MVRKLKFHEKKLLKKVDFLDWEVDRTNLNEVRSTQSSGMHGNKVLGLYDLNRKQSCFCRFSNSFENSLNVE